MRRRIMTKEYGIDEYNFSILKEEKPWMFLLFAVDLCFSRSVVPFLITSSLHIYNIYNLLDYFGL